MSEDKSNSFKDTVEYSDLGVIDIHKLGLRLVKENKKQYALLLLKVALVVALYIDAFALCIFGNGRFIGFFEKFNVFLKLQDIFFARPSSGIIYASVVLFAILVTLLIE